MILQRLAEHYDRLVAEGASEVAPPGFSMQKVSFCIVLEPNGTLNSFEDLRRLDGKVLRPRMLVLPGQSKPTGSGLNPCFLWDNAEYLLGFSQDSERSIRAQKAFEAFRDAHLRLEESLSDPAFAALCVFLRSWDPEHAQTYAEELTEKATYFGVFRIAGARQYLHEAVRRPEGSTDRPQSDDPVAMCLVSGKVGNTARLHEPKIKGVADAQTSGALLVSFNAPAFTSYGKNQSYNAPISTEVTFKYATALNHLLARRERRMRLGDATVVYWADHATWLENAFGELFSGPVERIVEEDKEQIDQARSLLTSVRSGTAIPPVPYDEIPTRFFVLGLSPNASRLSVRFWIEENASVLEARLRQHVDDLALVGGRDQPLPLWRIVAATGRAERDANRKLKSFDDRGVSPQLSGDLSRAVLTGSAYPQSLLATMIRRIRSDGEVAFARVSAIKACLVRNSRLRGASLEVPVEFDSQHADLAYRCGRLFAMLEKAQSDSLGSDLSSTIKDRYFSSASVTPALIFPRLFRMNGHHLGKLEGRSKIFYERLMGSVMAAPFHFPRRLNLEEQGRFIVGYFQQRQDLYTKKLKAPQEETTTV